MSIPTVQEEFAQLIEHLRKAQEHCATIGHLTGLQGSKEDRVLGNAWVTVSEMLKLMQIKTTTLAQGRLN
jgi:hypothetical protein